VNAAPAGSTVIIPNGSWAWSTGITCNKAITIMGASVGGVTITDNLNGNLVSLTPSLSGNIIFANVTFVVGNVGARAQQGFIYVNYSPGAKPYLIHDCKFSSSGQVQQHILTGQNGGVIWNCTFNGGNSGINVISADAAIQFKNGRVDVWNTPDSMGMSGDPTGTLNTYVEDCTFNQFYTPGTNVDDGSRVVFRHCTFYNTSTGSHGNDTSPFGVRHWEYYDNHFIYPYASGDPNAPNVQSWIIMRGGTGVITGNSFCPQNTVNWSSHTSVVWLSDAVTQGAAGKCYQIYPIPRAVGQGWNGGSGTYTENSPWGSGWATLTGYFTDPAYVWGNSTDNTYETGSADTQGWTNNVGCPGGFTSQQFIVANQDFFFNNGAKPGWSRYTYPHPLRGGSPRAPTAPQNLRVVTP